MGMTLDFRKNVRIKFSPFIFVFKLKDLLLWGSINQLIFQKYYFDDRKYLSNFLLFLKLWNPRFLFCKNFSFRLFLSRLKKNWQKNWNCFSRIKTLQILNQNFRVSLYFLQTFRIILEGPWNFYWQIFSLFFPKKIWKKFKN